MKPIRGGKGNFVGYTAAGPPLYNFAGEALHRTSQSVLVILKNGLRQILEESDSRSIFFFLCVNLVLLITVFDLCCNCHHTDLDLRNTFWITPEPKISPRSYKKIIVCFIIIFV